MVKVVGTPGQACAVGVTVIVVLTTSEVVFEPTNDGRVLLPVALVSPIEVLELTQLYVVPETLPAKVTALVDTL